MKGKCAKVEENIEGWARGLGSQGGYGDADGTKQREAMDLVEHMR
jgi:hypothetical protein